ncbi:hypothetical protein KY290_010199 [Solanum tuberosum]|uniref:Uncharacterized protein n=1 Tax=Solanum tuberosum TaxID=4113 RepID=A0ABQ7VX47_SOLTU|nr:hypothetical protein KY289_010584 [Solanum tuberosum]KAH0773062.1 hypothetical protein KY290_010199 [Solanum tuberosum]
MCGKLDYGCIKLYFIGHVDDFGETDDDFGEKKTFGVRLLYKDEAELHNRIRKSSYEEASYSSSKKRRSQVD